MAHTMTKKTSTYAMLKVEDEDKQDTTRYVVDTAPITKEAVPAVSFSKQRTSFKGTRSIPLATVSKVLKIQALPTLETFDPLAGLEGHRRDTMRVSLQLQLQELANQVPQLKEQARMLVNKIETLRNPTIDESRQSSKFQYAKQAAFQSIKSAKEAANNFQRLANYLHPDVQSMPFKLDYTQFQPLTDFQAKYDPACWTDIQPVHNAKDLPDPTIIALQEIAKAKEIRRREREIQKRLQSIRFIADDEAHDDQPPETTLLTTDFFNMLDEIPDITAKTGADGKPGKRNARDARNITMAESKFDAFTCPEHFTIVLHKGKAYLAPNDAPVVDATDAAQAPQEQKPVQEQSPIQEQTPQQVPVQEQDTFDDEYIIPEDWEDIL
jgi:hypothetical protein